MADLTRTILVADDDCFVRDDLREALSAAGYTLFFAATAKETLEQASAHQPDLVLLDLKFPDCADLSTLGKLKALPENPEVLILTSQTDNLALVVQAIKQGAYDYVGKPFAVEEIRNRVEKALHFRNLNNTQERLIESLRQRDHVDRLVGQSSAMQALRALLIKLADVDTHVLLQGECGTGKELAARALHFLSRRKAGPFVPVNCASIPEALVEATFFGHKRGAFTGALEAARGKFEAAEGGTVFLDEIGDMPLAQQAALLRVLESKRFTPVGDTVERELKARVIFATHRDLKERVREGKFREDLYYRINVARVLLPALRARPEDVPELAESLLQTLTAEMGQRPLRLSADVLEIFKVYDWPGNVRELKNILESAVILRGATQEEVTVSSLPSELQIDYAPPLAGGATAGIQGSGGTEWSPSARREKQELLDALQQAQGNQTQAAKILGCHRNTIRSRMRFYGVPNFEG